VSWSGEIERSFLVENKLDAGEMGRSKDLNVFDKGQIVMASRLGQSISEMTRLVGFSNASKCEVGLFVVRYKNC